MVSVDNSNPNKKEMNLIAKKFLKFFRDKNSFGKPKRQSLNRRNSRQGKKAKNSNEETNK